MIPLCSPSPTHRDGIRVRYDANGIIARVYDIMRGTEGLSSQGDWGCVDISGEGVKDLVSCSAALTAKTLKTNLPLYYWVDDVYTWSLRPRWPEIQVTRKRSKIQLHIPDVESPVSVCVKAINSKQAAVECSMGSNRLEFNTTELYKKCHKSVVMICLFNRNFGYVEVPVWV